MTRIEPLGDGALLIELGDRIDLEFNTRAVAIAAALRDAMLPGVSDIAPAYASVCVRYDPAAWRDAQHASPPHERISEHIRTLVEHLPETPTDTSAAAAIEIPVCYGGDYGPDLDDVAANCGIAVDEVIARHCRAEYRVAMLGFAPGFPYLLGLDSALHTPRRARPRTRVPAGSVAIGGAQTGIYPRELPGGWHIIGRTPLRLFDPASAAPTLLAAGQGVRFRAISGDDFSAAQR